MATKKGSIGHCMVPAPLSAGCASRKASPSNSRKGLGKAKQSTSSAAAGLATRCGQCTDRAWPKEDSDPPKSATSKDTAEASGRAAIAFTDSSCQIDATRCATQVSQQRRLGPDQLPPRLQWPEEGISVGSSRASSSGFGSDAACKKAGGGAGGRGSPRGGRPDGRCASSGRQRPARLPPQPHEARRLAPPDSRRLAPPRPPPAHEERHARTPEGRRSLAACARSPGGARAAPAAAGAASISARGDWYIDFLQIEQADGAVDSYGKGHGGEVLPVWRQNDTGNFRLAVEPGRGDAESWRRSSEQASARRAGA
ncbi:unnamed protein product [Prorocentrum cordatum]|uniref:Uncharacterized protein n=1 Tax=Prorocentrum cordatum TaxID=2364126 RepID=A0ABN9TSH7_9DINO|nr:unnamed protein product [Polarella glacialis]